jgi:tight adherence protein B
MDQIWIILALVFLSALLGIQSVYRLYSRRRQTSQSVNRRLALTNELRSSNAVFDVLKRERGLADFSHPVVTRLNDFFVQTGLRINRELLAVIFVIIFVVYSLIIGLGIGFGFGAVLLALILSAGSIFLFLRSKRNRRIDSFGRQLPDALDVIVRGVRVGHPFSTALNLVAKEMSDPIGTEFGMCSDEIAFGSDTKTAIENLYRRVGLEDLLFFIVAVNIQSQTGGNLSEVMSRLAALIRQRIKVRLRVQALSAEGRLSSIVLTLMPLLLFAAISFLSPSYFGSVRNHPAVLPALLIGLGLLVIGNWIMYKMVHFRV